MMAWSMLATVLLKQSCSVGLSSITSWLRLLDEFVLLRCPGFSIRFSRIRATSRFSNTAQPADAVTSAEQQVQTLDAKAVQLKYIRGTALCGPTRPVLEGIGARPTASG